MARRRERWLADARASLDATTLRDLWQAGETLTAEDAIAFALAEALTE